MINFLFPFLFYLNNIILAKRMHHSSLHDFFKASWYIINSPFWNVVRFVCSVVSQRVWKMQNVQITWRLLILWTKMCVSGTNFELQQTIKHFNICTTKHFLAKNLFIIFLLNIAVRDNNLIIHQMLQTWIANYYNNYNEFAQKVKKRSALNVNIGADFLLCTIKQVQK